jgi:hypothetical protein
MQQILMSDAASLFAMTALCKGEGGKSETEGARLEKGKNAKL